MLARLAVILLFVTNAFAEDDIQARSLIESVTAAMGGIERLQALRDVEYKYIYRDPSSGKEDVSTERYIFEGELSWASYSKRELVVFPETAGELVQSFDGKKTSVTLNGEEVKDEKLITKSDFLRKTNYYWFTMMFKLLDPGIIYTYEGTRTVSGTTYDVVRITFKVGVGDVSDIYVLYINPKTKMIDRFLFTVMDFNLKEPYLMTVEYEEVDGLKLPTQRRYAPANWDGSVKEEKWIDEISQNIQFGNGFKRADFSLSSSEPQKGQKSPQPEGREPLPE